MAQEHQRMNKVSAYLGLYGGLGIATSVLVQPYLIIPIAVGLGILEVVKPGSIRKLIDQSKDFAKDIISHLRQDAKRSVNLFRRVFRIKPETKKTVATAPQQSSFRNESQKNDFNTVATPETPAQANKIETPKQDPSAPKI